MIPVSAGAKGADVSLYKKQMDTGTLIFAIVMLHLVVGFGYMVYKLGGSSKSDRKP